ncbi:hypothetical protein B0H13DRAFT_1898182 [Mycena leptocephala]|nr:hypothetical protein B0H13DRAFT_1898182 [Mycena leptocephala]
MKASQVQVSLLECEDEIFLACRTKTQKGSTRRPEKSELRPNLDSSGLDEVKAKTGSDEDASIQRSGGCRLAASPFSHPSTPTRACTAPGAPKVHRKAAAGRTPQRRQSKIKAKNDQEFRKTP